MVGSSKLKFKMIATTAMDGGSAENAGAIFCRTKADIGSSNLLIDTNLLLPTNLNLVSQRQIL